VIVFSLWSALWIMVSGWGVQRLLVCPAFPRWCLRSSLGEPVLVLVRLGVVGRGWR
jgi:hypothetical protein